MLVLTFLLPFSIVLFLVEMVGEGDGLKKMLTSLKNYRYLLLNLVSRDLKTKYRRSALGVLWSVLNPLLMMLVLTAVFSNIFRFEIQDFPVYYLTGFVLFNFVSEATSFSMTSVINSAGLIKKVYIPKIIFPLEKCLFALVNLLFSLIAAVIVFLIVGVKPSFTMLLFFVPILYLFVFAFGFSLILATLNTFFRDVGYLYSVLLTVWMYLTPIIYPISILPGWMQSIVHVNPLYHYVEYFRAVTIYGTLPSLSANLICIAYALIFLLIGTVVFQKKQNKFVFFI
jgi:ABC-2 type transport system permease protein